jgi:holo-[acyl-carrier protein] synthase
MIGVDIVEIARFQDSYLSLAQRILSLKEKEALANLKSRERQIEYVASRFAGKEAFVKASGQKDVSYADISVLDDAEGKPHLFYKDQEQGEITLSHDKFAVAFVLLKP